MVPYDTKYCWNIIYMTVILTCIFYSSNQKAYADIYYDKEPQRKKEPDAPVFRPTAQNYTVGPGSKAKLKCRVDNLGTKTVVWRKQTDKHPLTIGLYTYVPDERISIDYNQRTNEWTLYIDDVNPKDEGIYLCTISTKEKIDKYAVNLTVKTVQVEPIGSEFIEKGNIIKLVCNASGKPDPPRDVYWFKDSTPISSDPSQGIMIKKRIESKMLISTLVIKKSKNSDTGFYECRSSSRESDQVQIRILDVDSSNVKRGRQKSLPSLPDLSSGHHTRVPTKKIVDAADNLELSHITNPIPSSTIKLSKAKFLILPVTYPPEGTKQGNNDPNALNIVGNNAACFLTANFMTISLTVFTSLIVTFNKVPLR